MTTRPQVELPPMRFSLAPRAGIIPHSLGKFVSYDDYAALATRLAESEARAEPGKRLAAAMRHVIDDSRLLPWLSSHASKFIKDALRDYDAAIAQEAEREAGSA